MSSTTFQTSVARVLQETRNVKELRRARHSNLRQFATDVCLVAHGVRTGYLVDAVYPPNPVQTLTALLTALRGKGSVFNDLVLWHHAPTAQSFLVHPSLLRERLAAMLGGGGDCVFVTLHKSLSVSKEPPDRLQEAIHDMRLFMTESPDAISFALPDMFTPDILVPLAAVMIDYPVAYCLACSAQTLFLHGEPLDVYTVSLRGTATSDPTLDLGKDHELLKFSCPQAVVNNYADLFPGTVIERLSAKFTANLGRAGIEMRACVAHQTETLDRVAL